jgi:cysteine desulfurase/selenocysteine lyase
MSTNTTRSSSSLDEIGTTRSFAQESRGGVVSGFDVQRVRRDFPILTERIHGKPLVYLDNAATTQKPRSVIDAMVRSYAEDNANIHRGVHLLSERATRAYEDAREKVQKFLNAPNAREIIFVRGTTEAINLVAQTFGRANVGKGDQVLITEMEHHSNIVPWQMLCEEKGAELKVLPITDEGELRMDLLDGLLTDRTRIVSVVHVSNSLGTINPIKAIVEKAHKLGIPVLVDGAQAVAHMPVDVQALGCDFYALSGHKLFGPTGIGVLWGRLPLLEAMPPYQGGGDMISAVTFKKTTYNVVPNKFEAGTPNIAGSVGLGAAIDYLKTLDSAAIHAYEDELLAYGTRALTSVPGIRMIGTASHKASILAFVMDDVHPHDIGTILDQEGVAIRTGHHCTQPLMERLCVPATARASLALYNTKEEIDALIGALGKVREIFA